MMLYLCDVTCQVGFTCFRQIVMMRIYLMVVSLGLVWNAFSRQDPVLMRINGKDVLRSEFEYSYNKDKALLAPECATPEKYVERFVDFKLKVAAAESAGLDTVLVFREKVEDYRNRLIKSYLTDTVVAEREARRLHGRITSGRRAGQVCVSQIFKYLPQNVSASVQRNVVARMDSIYEYLRNNQASEVFDACVRRFSDEKQAFWVRRLQMPVEFEDVVFDLPVGEVSQPFFTPQGIHIVKVIERMEAPSFDEVRNKTAEAHHHSMDLGAIAQVEKLKREYQYIPDETGMNELINTGQTERALFVLAGKSYTGNDFARFATAYPAGVRRQLEAFVMKTLLDYENTRLEQKYPDLRYLVQDYGNRLLTEEITAREILRRAVADEVGLRTYFEKHRSDYQWKERRYKGIVLHGISKRLVKQARKFLKSLPEEEWKDAIRLTFNAGAHPQIKAEQGLFAPGDNVYVDDLVFKGPDAVPMMSFPFTAVLGEKVKGPDDYREVKDRLVADYQTYLDARWMTRLRASAKVEINQEVLKTVNNH